MGWEKIHDKEIQIVTGGDSAFTPGICVTIVTILEGVPKNQPVSIHILDGGILVNDRDRIKKVSRHIHSQCSISFYNLSEYDFSGFAPGHNGSRMFYARLAMAEILSDLDKVIYIDSDTFVAGNLAELWSRDIGSKLAIVCRDRKIQKLSEDCPWELDEVHKQKSYFNSGVMVTNLAAWREIKLYENAKKLALESGSNIKWWDQTLLNFLLKDKIEFIPENWNWQREEKPLKTEILGVIHFTSKKKPWTYWGSDWRFEIWRKCYAKHFGSPIGLFLNRKSIKGLLNGHWDNLVITTKFFWRLKQLLLKLTLWVAIDKQKRLDIEKSLEFYQKLNPALKSSRKSPVVP